MPRLRVLGCVLSLVLCNLAGYSQTPAPARRPSPQLSNHYAVILEDAPVLDRFSTRDSARSLAAQSYRRQVEARQQALRSELEARHFPVVGSVSTSSNALFVTSPPERVDELKHLPGVLGVVRMRVVHEQLNAATKNMNAPAAWAALGGVANAGKGLKIAVLDSGIDQNHPAFNDPTLSMPTGFPMCTANHNEDCAYATNKVIVARSYVRQMAAPSDPKNPAADSYPDDYSPRDRVGHGTAIASVLAANQTTSPAVTIQGMAPKAWLGNYKVEGSPGVLGGTEDASVAALNDAFNDGMDIANYSLGVIATTGPLDTGATCGNPTGVPCDFLAYNFEKIAQAGMVIAVAVGNNGFDGQQYPTYNMISSPANAPSVIAVGGTLNSHVFQPTVSVPGAASNLQNLPAETSDAYSTFSAPSSAPLVDVSKIGNDGLACSALPGFSLYNSYALIQRGSCNFFNKAQNAANAGAIGIIFYMADATAPFPVEIQDPNTGDVPPLFGPVVMISNASGLALKNYLAAHAGAQVMVDPAGSEQDLATYNAEWLFSPAFTEKQLVGYSSPGPNAGDFAIKPDIVATAGGDQGNPFNYPDGGDFYFFGQSGFYKAAQSFDQGGDINITTGYVSVNGTSFAAPLVAGAAALVMQKHPLCGTVSQAAGCYTVAQVKAALVNTAAQDTVIDDSGFPLNAVNVGGGRLDAGAAVTTTVVATPVSFSFGNIAALSLPLTKQLQVTNFGGAAATLTLTVSAPADASGTKATGPTVALDKASLSLAAGASATVTVTLSGTLPATGPYTGTLTITGGAVPLHVPYLFLVGSSTVYDMTAIVYGQVATYNPCFEGLPSQDAGPLGVKLIDGSGVPIVNAPVTFSISPRGSATLQSAPGEPACTPGSTGTTTTCNTDAFGIAFTELILGPQVGASPIITARSGGLSMAFGGQGCAEVIVQPKITGVSDAAVGNPNIVPGSYISIYGSGLVNPDFVQNIAPALGDSAPYLPLPMGLDFVNVSFDIPGAYDGKPIDYNGFPGYFIFISNAGTQINLQAPWELQGASSVQVKVMVDGVGYTNVLTVPVVQFSPTIFQNSGQVAAIDLTTYAASPGPISASNPAHAGDVVELFGNGLGPVNNQPASGAPAPSDPLARTTSTVTATIGGQPATVGFAGLAPGYPGLYQINVTVPNGLPAGNQQVIISVGGVNSPSATIPIK